MESIDQLLQVLRRRVFSSYVSKERSIFLCGGASKQQATFRFQLGKTLSSLQSSYVYTVHYPETVFAETLYGHHKIDLLRLENYLARNVDSIVVPLQSPGTFTELGAFVNNDLLRNKLIVLSDKKYRLDRSFINQGPIALLKAERKNAVIYCDLLNSQLENLKDLSYKIAEVSRNIYSENPPHRTLDNPIAALLFYQCCIYLFDPISITSFGLIVEKMCTSLEEIEYVKNTILSAVVSSGGVRVLRNNYLSLSTDSFRKNLEKRGFSKIQIMNLMNYLWQIRPQVIDSYYRRSGIDFGGGPTVYRQ